MDLVRRILLALEGSDAGEVAAAEFLDGGHGLDLVWYHFRIMEQAGLADTALDFHDGPDGRGQLLLGPTWKGADFADALRDDGVWEQLRPYAGRVSSDVLVGMAEGMQTA